MSATNKIIIGLLLAAAVSVTISYAVLFGKINARDAEIARLELRLSDCGQRVKDADIAIARQNAAIEAVRVDTVVVVKQSAGVTKRYTDVREVVVKSIEKDSTNENKINIIADLLRDFHSVRAKDGNEN